MKKLILILVILVFLVSVGNAQWGLVAVPYQITGLTKTTSSNIFAGTNGFGLYRTTDSGWFWEQCSGLSNLTISSLTSNGNYVYAKNSSGLWYSTDQGVTWSDITLPTYPIRSLAANSSYLFAGTDSGVVRCVVTGGGWSYMRPNNSHTSFMKFIGTRLFASTMVGLFSTTNNGVNWINSNAGLPISQQLGYYEVRYMTPLGSNIYATSFGRIFKSTNTGLSWDSIPSPFPSYRGHMTGLIVVNNDNLFAGVDNSQNCFKSTNGGLNWITFIGLPNTYGSYDMVSSNLYILSQTNLGVYGALLQTVITKIEKSTKISDYSLSQNYPNPFNPSTTIQYQIPKEQFVTLKVFDITGKKIETLINENQSPGNYEVKWSASKYSSGVYYYRIETRSYSDTKSMLLIK
jgi:photosystem II stability/assembly factor-like uncharacterized protein